MSQVRLDALAGHLERKLAPLYVVHGDEPLLALEAGDAIRAAARRAGCDEREVFVVEPQFRWDAFLAEASEGNLLAARQELEKLALLLPAGLLDHEAVVDAVADVARYDIGALSEAWLAGEGARALRILAMLRDEGETPVLAVWQLSEDVHALAIVQGLVAQGVPAGNAVRQARVWGRRAAAMERAASRIPRGIAPSLVPTLAKLDALSKGLGKLDPWDELGAAALVIAGTPARPPIGQTRFG